LKFNRADEKQKVKREHKFIVAQKRRCFSSGGTSLYNLPERGNRLGLGQIL
jgi:hypothetical protein